MRTLGENIKKAREKSHKTQDELASSLSVSLSTVWRWEKGERTPTMGNLWRIAMELSIPMSELLEEVDEKDIPSPPNTYLDECDELQKIFSEEDLKTYINQVKELIQKIPYIEDPEGFFEIENVFIDELNEAKRKTYKLAEFHPPEHETYLKPEKHEKYGGIIGRVYPTEKRFMEEKVAFYQNFFEDGVKSILDSIKKDPIVQDDGIFALTPYASMRDRIRREASFISHDERMEIRDILHSALKELECAEGIRTKRQKLDGAVGEE